MVEQIRMTKSKISHPILLSQEHGIHVLLHQVIHPLWCYILVVQDTLPRLVQPVQHNPCVEPLHFTREPNTSVWVLYDIIVKYYMVVRGEVKTNTNDCLVHQVKLIL